MNTPAKILIGWLVWTTGVLVYALLSTQADVLYPNDTTTIEAAHTAMFLAYFIGTPILTGVWIVEGRK